MAPSAGQPSFTGGHEPARLRSRSRHGSRAAAARSASRERRGRRKARPEKEVDRRRAAGGRGRDRGGREKPPPAQADAAGGAAAHYPMPPPYGAATGPYGYPPGTPFGSYQMPPPVGGYHMHAMPRSSMPDDGVSVQVSEKFLMRNDYCQTFVDTGLRPQNFIRDLDYPNRYSEYPKIERLIKLKDEILAKRATPGMFLKCDLREFDLTTLGTKFDVILLDPPWEEYQSRVCGGYVPDEDLQPWTLEALKNLKVGEIADKESFCFLWCGATHLENGRELLKRWGFRRVEDICWVKTNRAAPTDERGHAKQGHVMYGDTSLLQRTKEHCLLGVKGSLKRSVDTHFIHANCDTDLIMAEEKEFGSTEKPSELYESIEHFCLGRRRVELFGLDRNMRDGWLTIGYQLTSSNWNKALYTSWFEGDNTWPETKDHVGGRLLGSTSEIDALRPKSPVRHDRGRGRKPNADPEDRPLPEDLGEHAPSYKEEDEAARAPIPPMNTEEMKYK